MREKKLEIVNEDSFLRSFVIKEEWNEEFRDVFFSVWSNRNRSLFIY